jgi:hypothetical protein
LAYLPNTLKSVRATLEAGYDLRFDAGRGRSISFLG